MKKPIIAGNWKLHKNPEEARDFFQGLVSELEAEAQEQFIVFPQAISLMVASEVLSSTQVGWGAQNVHSEIQGAFTGENSVESLTSLGATHCLAGHSERRQLFGETDEQIAAKFKAIQSAKLIPVLCVGETLEQREAGQTRDLVAHQLREALTLVNGEFIVAYEPVWAIGTGQVATPDQAEQVHGWIREELESHLPSQAQVPLLYGGSVKPENASGLNEQKNIDGFLIGGASLKLESFLGIFKNVKG